MTSRSKATMAMSLLAYGTALGQGGSAPVAAMPHIPGVVAAGTKVEMVAEFKGALNGPIALPDGSGVLITEVAGNRITKIDQQDRTSVFLDQTSGALCLAFDAKGRLIANLTQPPGQTTIAVLYPKGQEAVLAATFEGRGFGRPNDLVIDQKGGLYFTDPGPNEDQIKAGYLRVQPAVYYLSPAGNVLKIADGIAEPNGIQLSPNGRTLYVGDQGGEYVLAFDVQADGSVRNRRNFAPIQYGKESGADGMAVDNEGRVYLSARLKDGVQVFSPQGRHLGTIPSPGPGNIAFGGPGKRTLYLTGAGGVRKIQMLAQGIQGRAK